MKRKKMERVCEYCRGDVSVRRATSEQPYRYEMSGLDNVLLVGIDVEQCGKCGKQSAIIPKIAGLHRAMAKDLLAKNDLLTGKEMRFLRKNAGISAARFAALIKVDPSHLSRLENGRTENLGASTDKLARVIVLAAGNADEEAHQVLMDEADRRIEADPITFGLRKNHWEKLAA